VHTTPLTPAAAAAPGAASLWWWNSLAALEQKPLEKMKHPTPKSIKLVPNVSVFPKRRGKMVKSTARMAMAEVSITPAR
jgi:hypothetical protein